MHRRNFFYENILYSDTLNITRLEEVQRLQECCSTKMNSFIDSVNEAYNRRASYFNEWVKIK